MKAERTKGGHRRYRIEDIEQLQGIVSEDAPPNDCAAINLKNLAVRVVRPEQACVMQANAHGEDVRPTAVPLAASLKWEPSIESHGRF